MIDAVRAWAGNPMFILLHVVVIGGWIGWNVRGGGFDPYPFGFLNMTLAMEAIFLSSFVLMAQDRMTRDADRRDHLNLQVDLLAEQELTAILNVVVAIANRAGIDVRAQDCRRSIGSARGRMFTRSRRASSVSSATQKRTARP